MITINTLGENITIEVQNYGPDSTIHIKGTDTNCEIHIGQSNLDYLRQKLSPQGLIPDDFPMKIVMMNQLIEDIDGIRDINDQDWKLEKVFYNKDEDKLKKLEADTVYFYCKEVE
jgi:hypothetical protein